VSAPRIRSFYRIATAFPPPVGDYRTQRQKRGDYPPTLPADLRESWDHGLSAFDIEDAAVAQAKGARGRLGNLIVRYDIPEGAGIAWQQTGRNPRHHDLFGDFEELKRYLSDDYIIIE
jgi:hypothetical protein